MGLGSRFGVGMFGLSSRCFLKCDGNVDDVRMLKRCAATSCAVHWGTGKPQA